MSLIRYISHPEVAIDPDIVVADWSLTPIGRRRVMAVLGQPWVASIGQVVTSAETKAVEAAAIIGSHLGLVPDVRPATGETDRSSTGYVTHQRHEELADAFFARPDQRAAGWERATDVQSRIVDALADVLGADADHDVVVVGHGGAGTLLYCHLAGLAIDRRHDQPRAGCCWRG